MCFQQLRLMARTYRVLVRLLVLGPVRRVGELLVAVELDGELAAERLLAGVRPDVDLPVFRSGECSVTVLELKRKNDDVIVASACD